MNSRTILAAATGLLLAAILAGCGGGDDGDDADRLSVWTGTTDTNRDLSGVVLPDGNYYLLYSSVLADDVVGGAVQGTATVNGEAFASTDALDFSAEGLGIRPSTVAATIRPTDSFNGSVTPAAGGTAVNFQTRGYGNFFNAALAPLAGSYTGTAGFALGVRPAVFTVTADGAVSSTINGCAITGTATPRTDGDAYDLTIAFGGAPCAVPIQGMSFTGLAWLRPDNGRLQAVARNAATKQSVIFSGAK